MGYGRAAKPDSIQAPGPTEQKERTVAYKLFSDLHTGADGPADPHTAEMLKIST